MFTKKVNAILSVKAITKQYIKHILRFVVVVHSVVSDFATP